MKRGKRDESKGDKARKVIRKLGNLRKTKKTRDARKTFKNKTDMKVTT